MYSTTGNYRSGRAFADAESKDQSTETSEPPKKTPSLSQSLNHDNDLHDSTVPLNFLDIIQASEHYKIPSTHINNLGVAERIGSAPELFSLGSGLTADVFRHVTGEETKHILPPKSIVALKAFKSGNHDSSPSAVGEARNGVYRAILREIRTYCHPILRKHPNIARVHFLGWQKTGRFPILGMELGEHGSLDFVIREAHPGPTPIQKRHIALDIALGLSAIHRAGFIHGDLKPDNILIMAHEDPTRGIIAKLTDFGGSAQLSSRKGSGSPAHLTKLWSAPEVVAKDPDVDWEKADIYSYGLVVISLLIRMDGETLVERPGRSSSCILSWSIPMSAGETYSEDYIWLVKNSLERYGIFNNILDMMAISNDVENPPLLDVLRPTLEPYFWNRPSTKALVESLVPFGEDIGRCIEQEESETSESTQEDFKTQSGLDHGPDPQETPDQNDDDRFWFQRVRLKQAMFEQHSLILEDIKNLLHQGSSNNDIDIPPELPKGISRTGFIRILHDTLGGLRNSGIIQAEAKLAGLRERAWQQGLFHFFEGRLNLEAALDWMNVAALCGSSRGMHLIVFMATEDTATRQFPVRLYLSLLALSNSDFALHRLSSQWPNHFNMISDILRERKLISKATRVKPDSLSLLQMLELYSKSHPVIEKPVTLRQALDVGDSAAVKQVLSGETMTDSQAEIIPDLLYELSHLTDTEASELARTAFERGAKLSNLISGQSPLLSRGPLIDNECLHPTPYSPLSSAISHGKTELAMAILYLHVETATAIPDFMIALCLSFRYLQHEVGECLLGLLEDNTLMDDARPRDTMKTLNELVLYTMYNIDDSELDRRVMHGSEFDSRYEKCLRILLEEGADPIQVDDEICPWCKALKKDDIIGLKLFTQKLHSCGFPVIDHVRDAGKAWHSNLGIDHLKAHGALSLCIGFRAIRCFEYLVKAFPDLIFEEVCRGGITLLHLACARSAHMDFIRILLENDAHMVDTHLFPGHSALLIALDAFYLPAADLIASQCSSYLETMIGRDVGGKSLFAILIQGWSVNRKPELIDSLKWLANHGGMHFYGPEDRPIWEYVFRGPRPNRRQDQIQDSYLLEFLLGLEAFSSRINEKASNDTTLLHVLAGGGHVEAMRVLLKRSDVDLNAGFSFTTPYGSSYREFSTSNWTALDLAISLLGVSGAYPPSIESGGKLEIHKWVQDIRSIIKQLKDKAGKNYKIGKLQQHIEEKAAKQREMLLRDGLPFSTRRRNFHGGWPQPLSSSKPTQEVEEETGMKYPPEEVLDDLLLGTLSEDLEATQRQLFLDAESMYRPLYGFRSELEANEHFKREAELQRKTWRLPPEWVLISVNGEKEKTSFVNIDTGEIVNKKPALYRGERDRISSYDRKGKGKETTPVDKSPGNHYVFINAMPQMTPIVIDIEETPRPEINFDSDETAEKVAHALGIFDQDITSLRETLLDKLLQEMAIDYKFECRETWWRG